MKTQDGFWTRNNRHSRIQEADFVLRRANSNRLPNIGLSVGRKRAPLISNELSDLQTNSDNAVWTNAFYDVINAETLSSFTNNLTSGLKILSIWTSSNLLPSCNRSTACLFVAKYHLNIISVMLQKPVHYPCVPEFSYNWLVVFAQSIFQVICSSPAWQ